MTARPLNVVAWLLSMMMVASGKPMGYDYPVPEVPFIEGAPVSTTPSPDCVPRDLQDSPYYTSLLDMGVSLCPDYDEYDPSDIPADQARQVEVTEGYNYPVPDNPLLLPTSPPLPDCVPTSETALGDNPYYLDQGVPLCPEDLPVYTPDCVLYEEREEGPNTAYLEQGVPLCPQTDYDEYDPNDIPIDQAKPVEVTEGYNYPIPENPLTLPTKPRPTTPVTTTPLPTTTELSLPDCVSEDDPMLDIYTELGVELCPTEYDEYDPSDIPTDQAKPSDVTEGYNYPTPENPLTLPTPPTTLPPLPPCVPVDEADLGDSPYYLDQGVPLCPDYDEYDPSDIPADQARPVEVTEGYNYPVPDNPLTLPSPLTTTTISLPDCVVVEEEGADVLIRQGVPQCPELPGSTAPPPDYDEYDPSDIPEDQAKPDDGYSYPVPDNPLELPSIIIEEELPAYTPAPVDDYDEYDPSDVPADQARPDDSAGYSYPVPDNPLELPARTRKAKLGFQASSDPDLTIGLTHLDTDSYDPLDYSHNSPDYLELERLVMTPETSAQPVTEAGVSITGVGRVFSFHLPDTARLGKKKPKEDFSLEKHEDPFSTLLGGELHPPSMKTGQKHRGKMGENKLNTGQKSRVKEGKKVKVDQKLKNRVKKKERRDKSRRGQKNRKKDGLHNERPRGGKSLRPTTRGRKNISVIAWLARG